MEQRISGSALTRIHSILQHSVVMRASDIEHVASNCEQHLTDETFCASNPIRGCFMQDGWLPIASLLNYSPLGEIVWPFGGVGVVADCISTRGSHLLEISGDRACVRRKPWRVQLRNQLEFIFSDENYHKDVHLQLLQEKDGFTPIQLVVSTYQSLQELMKHVEVGQSWLDLVCEAVGTSSELVLRPSATRSDDSTRLPSVRRMTLAERIKSQIEWYLDPDRMAADRFLVEQARDHSDWVPISQVLSFPRMRKLCHPQISAVAHVLSSSSKLEVSDDKTLVRPLLRPPSSLAHSSKNTPSSRKLVLTMAEKLMSDANLAFDRELHSAIAADSPPEALKPGGVGARIQLQTFLRHPSMRALKGDLAEALKQHDSKYYEKFTHVVDSMVDHLVAQMIELSSDCEFIVRQTPSPEIRQFSPATTLASSTAPRGAARDFSVMTYNLLADMLCTCEQFPSISIEHLDWANRLPLIEAEIKFHMPDILCLQELQGTAAGVGVDDHHAALHASLSACGFSSRYLRKVKRNGSTWPHTQIGNAIFWRSDTFDFVEHLEIPIAPLLNAACEDEISAAHFGRGAQVGLAVVLRHKRAKRLVVALTTHLSCNFQEPWTQIAQVHTVLTRATALASKYGPHTPLVFGGDLNSIPGSGVYHLVTTGKVAHGHPDLRIIAEQVEMPSLGAQNGMGGGIFLPLSLQSAYANVLGESASFVLLCVGGGIDLDCNLMIGQEPLFTNFTAKYIGTLDYIFYEPNSLKPSRVLMLPTEDTVRLEGTLPSSRFASDHLPLLAHFEFLSQTNAATCQARLWRSVASEEQSSPKRSHGGLEGGRSSRSRQKPRQKNS